MELDYCERRKTDGKFTEYSFFQVEPGPQIQAKDILEIVYKALKEKGYNPVNQIVGYIMSGDPTYITSYNGARSLIMKVERDELVEEMLKAYISNNSWES
nr:IreB family regulatory phosphoprotein [Mediterraneibacter butyricigenes]